MCRDCATANEQTKAAGGDSSGPSQPVAPSAKHCHASHPAVEADNSSAAQPAGAGTPSDSLMEAIRILGRLPKETRTATQVEKLLVQRLRTSRLAGKVSGEEEEAELGVMSAKDSALAAD